MPKMSHHDAILASRVRKGVEMAFGYLPENPR